MDNDPPDETDVVVVGAGPAGLMAALTAAATGQSVIVLERMAKPGLKLLATGGGRCNFCNLSPLPEFLQQFPPRAARFIRTGIYALDSAAIRRFFHKFGVESYSPDGWRVYPKSEFARDTLQALLDACRQAGVRIFCGREVTGVRVNNGAICGVDCARKPICCRHIVLACGGMSRPELGSDGSGFDLARALGHTIVQPVPALTPLLCHDRLVANLAGISLKNVRVSLLVEKRKVAERLGDLLFTHKGVSGPAILDLSGDVAAARAQGRAVILEVALVPQIKDWRAQFQEWRQQRGGSRLESLLGGFLPARLARRVLEASGAGEDQNISSLTAEHEHKLLGLLDAYPLHIRGTEGFSAAMTCRGGVALDEVSPKTMESRKCKGLYFAGEILDIDGPCGGYNLQWAFSSGHNVRLGK